MRDTNWVNGGGRFTHKDILDKLDRIELWLVEKRLGEEPGTFGWLQYLDAAMSVRACRKLVEREAKGGSEQSQSVS